MAKFKVNSDWEILYQEAGVIALIRRKPGSLGYRGFLLPGCESTVWNNHYLPAGYDNCYACGKTLAKPDKKYSTLLYLLT